MATSLTCDMCGDEPAVAMVTSLANGDTLAVGEACQPLFHLAAAAELIKAMGPELAAAYEPPVTAVLDAYGALAAAASGLTPAAELDGGPDATQPQTPAEGTQDDNGTPRKDQPAAGATTADDHARTPDRRRRGRTD